MTERITTSHDVLLGLHDELDVKDAEIAALKEVLKTLEQMMDWEPMELGLMSELIYQTLKAKTPT